MALVSTATLKRKRLDQRKGSKPDPRETATVTNPRRSLWRKKYYA